MNRYYWVLWTYVTRPMVWLLTIVTVMIVSILVWIGTSADQYVSTFGRVPSRSLDLSRLQNPEQSESFDLGQLRELKQLESLDFGQISKVESMDVIKDLPRLTSVSFGSPRLITKENMQLVSEVSSLRDVYLPDIAEESDALEAIELLNQSGSLNTVHVAIPLAESENFALVRDRVTNIRVQTSQYRPISGGFHISIFLATDPLMSNHVACNRAIHDATCNFVSEFQSRSSSGLVVPRFDHFDRIVSGRIHRGN